MWPPRSLVITDRTRLAHGGGDDGERLVSFVRAVAEAGVDAVQVRERDWVDARLLDMTRRLCGAVRHTRCRLLVNERAHVAWAGGAHGVHLRGRGMAAARLRAVQPAGLIGRSVHADDGPEVLAGLSYAVFGTVFASRSKEPGGEVAGVAALAAWARQAEGTPVVAVGGIELGRCAAVRDAGACGVAAIGLFASAWQAGSGALTSTVDAIHAVFADGERAE